ncbi:MAG: helix-turn-helix transcriptional regulator [Archangium sp.]|nr:helix-turn-helix transcriptional regulator [Archangium sp.]
MTDALSQTFAALADPTRRALLARLSKRVESVGELARPFDMSLAAVSKHLQVLERAGLVSRSKDAQWRVCQLEPKPLREVDGWLDAYRRFWDRSLDEMAVVIATLHPPAGKPAPKRKKRKS